MQSLQPIKISEISDFKERSSAGFIFKLLWYSSLSASIFTGHFVAWGIFGVLTLGSFCIAIAESDSHGGTEIIEALLENFFVSIMHFFRIGKIKYYYKLSDMTKTYNEIIRNKEDLTNQQNQELKDFHDFIVEGFRLDNVYRKSKLKSESYKKHLPSFQNKIDMKEYFKSGMNNLDAYRKKVDDLVGKSL